MKRLKFVPVSHSATASLRRRNGTSCRIFDEQRTDHAQRWGSIRSLNPSKRGRTASLDLSHSAPSLTLGFCSCAPSQWSSTLARPSHATATKYGRPRQHTRVQYSSSGRHAQGPRPSGCEKLAPSTQILVQIDHHTQQPGGEIAAYGWRVSTKRWSRRQNSLGHYAKSVAPLKQTGAIVRLSIDSGTTLVSTIVFPTAYLKSGHAAVQQTTAHRSYRRRLRPSSRRHPHSKAQQKRQKGRSQKFHAHG